MSLERFTHREVVTAPASTTVAEIARLMQTRHVGSVIIVAGGRPIGIVTDRDLVVRVLAEDRSPASAVAEIMTTDVFVAHVGDALDNAFNVMRYRGVRRLPIVDGDGALVGVVAMDDLLVLISGEVSSMAEAVMENRGP